MSGENARLDCIGGEVAGSSPAAVRRPHLSSLPPALRRSLSVCRFFDATPHAEFLFDCVRRTIEEDLPNETDFLRRYDRFTGHLQAIADMPDRTADLLFRFLHQNAGRLSNRARKGEFERLTDEETERIERLYGEVFGLPEGNP